MRLSVLLLACFSLTSVHAQTDFGGHGKFRVLANQLPSDSLFRTVSPSTPLDIEGDLRLNFEARKDKWRFDASYSLFALSGDRLEYAQLLADSFGQSVLPDDDRRLFDFTHIISDSSDSAVLHRLDRFSLTYSDDTRVIRFGRQALSWGNGLFFSPMDLVNPFDPAAIDTEYKAGDDMLYLQQLRSNGDDLQAAFVIRRDPVSGDVKEDVSSSLLKYHGFAGTLEYDLMLGRHYGESVLGAGLAGSLDGAVWRSDLVLQDATDGVTAQWVANISYSWVMGGHNTSGSLELYHNGFGLDDEQISAVDIAADQELLSRLQRGEAFNVGRNYLAGSLTVEWTPLLSFSPVLFSNLDDGSALVQLSGQYSLADEWLVLGSLNVPIGPSGTEFGGIASGLPGFTLAGGAGVFLQIAGYF